MKKIIAKESQVEKFVKRYVLLKGDFLQRNNVGAWKDKFGRYIRYGLHNESKEMNDREKSSDEIGIRKLLITQEMVGSYVGQYMALEIKHEGWEYKGTKHEKAQKAYIDMINSMGGYARFVTCIEDVYDNKKG